MIQQAQGGDSDAMWRVIISFDGVIRQIIRSVAASARPDDVDDLMQEARAVICQKIRDYTTDADAAQLATFLHLALRRAIATAWVRMTHGLTVEPIAVLTVKRALWDADGDTEAAWVMVGSSDNAKRRMSRETFVSVLDALQDTSSLDKPADETGLTLADTIAESVDEIEDPTERRQLAYWLLEQIKARHSYVLRAYYGIGMTAMSDAEVCDDMGLKPVAVRMLRLRGITRARQVAERVGLSA
ncbi:hypothetical protein [Streptomyces albipurpureus]|uniref:RNA polymerase sigma-70 region 2 domain-containing protein n=1 Tax=Streptomyces albipurpureus TaxID=2897419 RepID=A0ABT0UTQ1_9ACTN|nr:hypothetical protein [Streptomyces sp. CWNU-1]MCM2391757.1 hypothetical protein [Streptomyces sp. CWNU-1]